MSCARTFRRAASTSVKPRRDGIASSPITASRRPRFLLGVDIKPDQIKSYYENTLVPEYQRQHVPAPKLESISSEIREVLLQQQISNLLQDWLKSLRAQGSVVVLHPGEEAP